MRTSQRGIDLIKEFEGYSERVYMCAGGKYTIGYGHTRGVEVGDACTREQAEKYLREDLQEAEESVLALITVPLSQNQFDALVSLVYNIGSGNFYDSTIRRVINANGGDMEKYRKAWMMWVKSRGKVLKGLERRRVAEFNLFCSND
ncbi:MAG: lysozyme [Bacteroidales bacterium]|nr:lysozyme [Bacteroidales bacterium]